MGKQTGDNATNRGTPQDPRENFGHLRIAIIGNLNPPGSGITYQAEVLIDNFTREGACVLPVTHVQNRYLRPLATAFELWLGRRDYDVVCCQAFSFGNWTNAAVAICLSKLLRKHIVVVYRGGGFAEFVRRWKWAVVPVLRLADRLVTPSRFLFEQFRPHGLTATIIPNVIEYDGWPYRRRTRLRPGLIWVRHLREGYNPWMAVEVLQRVQRRFPDATLRMAGDGHMKNEIETRLVRERVRGVELLGHLRPEELKRHLHECDVFINTTNYDNQPRSVLEAIACGLPVVSTNVGGLPYLLRHGVEGVLVPPGDPDHMAHAVCDLLDEPAKAAAMSDAALRLVKSFTWNDVRQKWRDLFADLGLLQTDTAAFPHRVFPFGLPGGLS